LAALKRLDHCWFILAGGATPSAHARSKIREENDLINEACTLEEGIKAAACIDRKPIDSDEELTYCEVGQLGWPDDAEEAVNVLEHGLEHLVERRRRTHLLGRSIWTRQRSIANTTRIALCF
jgi:hypothetical protein